MKHKFALGVISGMSALTLAVPAIAQIAGAQSVPATNSVSAATKAGMPSRMKSFTQADVQTMIQRDQAFLANVDAMVTLQKSATQVHLTALQAAANITDETERLEALKKAHDDMRATIEAAVTANPNLKLAMPFGGGKHGGKDFGGRHGPGDLAEKLGMTEVELKAAMDSGKTIEQIATEKGVTLPARPMGGGFGGRGHGGPMGGMMKTPTDAQ